MDAVSCVGVAPAPVLTPRSFADAAIARALHASLCDIPEPSAAATTAAAAVAAMHGAGAGAHPPTGSAAPSPSPSSSSARGRLGPSGGRPGKRRPRPSKRVPTTYISTDAATFRLMVQRVTGADEGVEPPHDGAGLGGLLLPHLGGVGQLLHACPAPHHVAAAAAAAYAEPQPAVPEPLFPTLDSWSAVFGKDEVV